jgi:hypothetical protein
MKGGILHIYNCIYTDYPVKNIQFNLPAELNTGYPELAGCMSVQL